MTIAEFVIFVGTMLFGLVAFLYYVSHVLEKGTNKAGKDLLRQNFRSFASFAFTTRIRPAFVFFVAAADHYFGPKLFSVRAFGKSALLTVFWMAMVLTVFVFLFPSYQYTLKVIMMDDIIFRSAASLILATIVIDFLSACLTRGLISWSLPRGRFVIAGIVGLDLIASIALFYLFFNVARLLVGASFLTPSQALSNWTTNLSGVPAELATTNTVIVEDLPDGTSRFLSPETGAETGLSTELVYAFPEVVSFISSLLTSAWMWLYAVAYLILTFAVKTDTLKGRLVSYLDFDTNPFFAMSTMILVIAIVIAVVSTLFFALLQIW